MRKENDFSKCTEVEISKGSKWTTLATAVSLKAGSEEIRLER